MGPVVGPVLGAAFYRAAMLALLTGAVTALTSRQQGLSWEDCLIGGAIVLITTLIARAGLEGGYDANRATNNDLNKGDVPVAAPNVEIIKP